jgi:hypothetical protein
MNPKWMDKFFTNSKDVTSASLLLNLIGWTHRIICVTLVLFAGASARVLALVVTEYRQLSDQVFDPSQCLGAR